MGLGYIIIMVVMMIISFAVQGKLRSKFTYYSEQRLRNGLTGQEIAQKMLEDHGIYDVKITQVDGQLSDHYNPQNKTVNLSHEVYYGNSTASAAVAAHECGHAVQHARAYSMLSLRSRLVPLQNISSTLLNVVVFGGAFLGFGLGHSSTGLLIVIACYAIITLFSLVTLPVEFDASQRALVWMEQKGVVTSAEHDGAKDALKWAAMTYVAAAVGALVNLVYFILRFVGRSSD